MEAIVPRGFTGLREAAADIEARKQGSGGPWVQWFKLREDNASAVVRFLEQGDEIAWCWMHQLPPKENQSFGDMEPCLNTNNDGTPCPGCESRDPKVSRRVVNGFINVIWRDGPVWATEERDGKTVLKKTSENKLIQAGTADVVSVWKGGVQLFEELDGIDAAYHGLVSRDFRVTRKGLGLNTKYQIMPADPDAGPQPLSDADNKLAAEKYDLMPFVTPKPYEDWGKSTKPDSSGFSGESGNSGSDDVSPFMRSRS